MKEIALSILFISLGSKERGIYENAKEILAQRREDISIERAAEISTRLLREKAILPSRFAKRLSEIAEDEDAFYFWLSEFLDVFFARSLGSPRKGLPKLIDLFTEALEASKKNISKKTIEALKETKHKGSMRAKVKRLLER